MPQSIWGGVLDTGQASLRGGGIVLFHVEARTKVRGALYNFPILSRYSPYLCVPYGVDHPCNALRL